MRSEVLTFTKKGLYCEAGGFFVDPWRPVERALVTHGHADHARASMGTYLCTASAAPVIRHRLGQISVSTVDFGVRQKIGDATVSFHPAGHVPGSAQIRIEVGGEVWVVSGDYKVVDDGVSEPFEPVRCHTFISECTFGLPVFNWDAPGTVSNDINAWWAANRAEGAYSMCGAYSLGKAQRILASLDQSIGPVLTHGAIENTNVVLRNQGIKLPETVLVTPDLNVKDYPGAFVLAPPSALGSAWSKKFKPTRTAFASGWMALRGVRRRRAADRGFIMSDHADWAGLNSAIAATGAERVFVTHGYTSVFRRWLESQGYDAAVVETEFGGDEETETLEST
ncbi:MAG: ligase-associated DNA damage response exonuclease [Boseongicola sp.]|nr:ligase-associated DNA damage response exonuclease [Boseongicola sp.]MDD9978198.1 ligase-associated DNA damage response exonuclease [Boseongicola sp.]